jgi:hypothetical protein
MNGRWDKLAAGKQTRRVGAYAALFAAASWQANMKIAAVVVLAFIVGPLLHFYLVRPVLLLLRGAPKPTPREMPLGSVGVLGGVILIYFGYGVLVALCYAMALVIDASTSLARFAGSR